MNRRIAALTIATVAVLGLTACSSSPSASESPSADAGSSAPAEEQSSEQSLTDACAEAGAQVQEATKTLSELDVTAATADPQGTIAQYTEAAEAIGAAAESVSNPEVKAAVSAFHEDFATMNDLLSRLLIDQDASAVAEIGAVATEIQESAAAIGTLCAA